MCVCAVCATTRMMHLRMAKQLKHMREESSANQAIEGRARERQEEREEKAKTIYNEGE